jgi:PA14 domain-containing protein/K319-like protein
METGVHHNIKDETFSIRFTGFIEPQFSESYRFSIQTGGGVRLWVDGKLLLDKWNDMYPTTLTSSSINLVAGKQYAIKIEYLNNDDRSGLYLNWQSASQSLQMVPQPQLYPAAIEPTDPPANKPPSASAGQDETINLHLTLSGSGSDTDGIIVAYKWEKLSGPECVIEAPDKSITTVNKVQPGSYLFRLTVIDNKGAIASSTVTKILQ